MLDSFGLTQHIQEPTHQQGNTLDLLMTSGLDIENVSVKQMPISDHYCVFYEANIIVKTSRGKLLVHRRILDDSAETKFSNIMQSITPCNDPPLNQIVQNLHCTLSTVLDTVAPLKDKKVNTDRVSPWLNSTDIKDKKRRCRAAERNSQCTIVYTKTP